MKAAGRKLAKVFPNLVHVTCFAHGLHRVVEVVIDQYPKAKGLLSAVKGMLARSPQRKIVLKQLCNRLLPAFVPTRWTSFLEALPLYIEHYDHLKDFLKELRKDKKSSSDITGAEQLLYDHETLREMHELHTRYGCFVEAIKELQRENLPLGEALEIATKLSAKLSAFDDHIGRKVYEKWSEVATKNAGLEVLHQLYSKTDPSPDLLKRLGLTTIKRENVPFYLQATTVTADVERLFSKYNLHFSHLRQSSSVSTMNTILAVQTNSNGMFLHLFSLF